MKPKEIDWDRLRAIVEDYRGRKWGLIPLLQEIQESFGYIPPESIESIAEALDLFPTQVQGVITFYAGFTLKPKGKYVIRVCDCLACYLEGSDSLLEAIREAAGITASETMSSDGLFSLHRTSCIGLCEQAPAMMINQERYGLLNPEKVSWIISSLRQKENMKEGRGK